MNTQEIDYRDAWDAEQMSGAVNLKGVANTMLRMVSNVCSNDDRLANDEGTTTLVGNLQEIIDADIHNGSHPYTLREDMFEAVKAIYEMAFRIKKRTEIMTYSPLVVAAQVLANIVVNASYYDRPNARGEIVSHDRMQEIDLAVPDPFSVYFGNESIYVDYYGTALQECKERIAEGMWTEEKVKAELPNVPVELANYDVKSCSVNGRQLPFAKVTLPDGGSIEVAWATIANILNKRTVLKL